MGTKKMATRILSVVMTIVGALACLWAFGLMVDGTSMWGSALALEGTNGNAILLAVVLGTGAFGVGLCGLTPEKPEHDEQAGLTH
jgi:hypothetical protein